MKEVAILGATASGKSALAIDIAKEVGANILSLDSLAIYKEMDIVSAKPSLQEREGIPHFGIDEISIDAYFSAATFFDFISLASILTLTDCSIDETARWVNLEEEPSPTPCRPTTSP